jgi:uncharacterized DUF497 family protein
MIGLVSTELAVLSYRKFIYSDKIKRGEKFMVDLSNTEGFEWDGGNSNKNWDRHQVSNTECEEIFFNIPIITPDLKHSQIEARYYALGHTNASRKLYIAFTIRQNKIRVISARDMKKKEKAIYNKSLL